MTRVAFVPRSAALRSAGLAFARKLRIETRGTLMVGCDRIENGSSVVSSILNQVSKVCMTSQDSRNNVLWTRVRDFVGTKYVVSRKHLYAQQKGKFHDSSKEQRYKTRGRRRWGCRQVAWRGRWSCWRSFMSSIRRWISVTAGDVERKRGNGEVASYKLPTVDITSSGRARSSLTILRFLAPSNLSTLAS